MEKVINWITEKETHNREYYEDCFGQKTSYSIYREAKYDEDIEDALIKELIEKEYIICGDTHQYYCLPVFENNRYLELSMRKWGEIMTEVWKLRGFTTRPNFYLKALCSEEEKLPYEIER